MNKFPYIRYKVLVDETVEEILTDVRSRTDFEVFDLGSTDYLKAFSENLEYVKQKSLISGEPDSFIVASCLADALLQKKLLTFDLNDDIPAEVLLINYRIALAVALKACAEPTTYRLNEETQCWISKIHPKVNMNIPYGIIPSDSLYDRIIKSWAVQAYNWEKPFHIVTFAHHLHTIYLLNSK